MDASTTGSVGAPRATRGPLSLFTWWSAIRPRTLTLAACGPLPGLALAVHAGAGLDAGIAALTLACAMLIQIGTNLANDAGDFRRGGDGPGRLGPLRACASGWLSVATVERAAALSFAAALVCGGLLVARGGWPIFALGLAALLAGAAYSHGPRPINASGWGEATVVLFFGVAATCGTFWLQALAWSLDAALAGTACGLVAAAVLAVNNARDADADRATGRHTLAVTHGERFARAEIAGLVLAPFALAVVWAVSAGRPAPLAILLLLPVAWRVCVTVRTAATGAGWNAALAATVRLHALLSLILTTALLCAY